MKRLLIFIFTLLLFCAFAAGCTAKKKDQDDQTSTNDAVQAVNESTQNDSSPSESVAQSTQIPHNEAKISSEPVQTMQTVGHDEADAQVLIDEITQEMSDLNGIFGGINNDEFMDVD